MKSKEERFAVNPRTGEIVYKTTDILVYGITDEERIIVSNSLPNNKVHINDCNGCFIDILALPCIAMIINPDALNQENAKALNEFYGEMGSFNEKIIFSKNHPLLKLLNNLKCTVYNDEIEFKENLKYCLLDALKLNKKYDNYSEVMSQTIRVLSEIRKHPGITTAQLAEIIERNPRTVQRYIATLNCAGDFIEYDKKKKGWFLFENKSVLFGDY